MTPQDHNKALGIMHLIYGGFQTLLMLVTALLFAFFAGLLRNMTHDAGDQSAILFTIMAAMAAFYLLLAVPPLVAGYALLKKKSWSRTAGIVSGIVAALSFPFGTALCVYSLWFFFGERGTRFYKGVEARARAHRALNRAAATFEGYGWQPRATEATEQPQQRTQQEQARPYVPPTEPPDWRS